MSELDQLIDQAESSVHEQKPRRGRASVAQGLSFGSPRVLIGAIVVLSVCIFWRSEQLWGPAGAAIESDALRILTLAEQEIEHARQIDGELPTQLPSTLPKDHVSYILLEDGYRLSLRIASHEYGLTRNAGGRRLTGDFKGGN